MKKLFLLFTMTFLLIGLVSAGVKTTFESNDDKINHLNTKTQYGKYIIEETKWWDLLKIGSTEKIKEVELIENTDECSDNCFAIKEVTNLKPMPLIEDVRFFRDFGDDNWILWNGFTNWKIEVEEDIDIFETSCKNGKEITDKKNGTSYTEQICEQVKVRTEKQWRPLDYKKDYEGTYKVKLSGGKKDSTILDWEVKMNGVWSDKWSVWGNTSEGDESEVVLNSPVDGSIVYENPVTFNASANVTGGAILTNMSLWGNFSGIWSLNESYSNFGIIQKEYNNNTLTTTESNLWRYGMRINITNNENIKLREVEKASGALGTTLRIYNNANSLVYSSTNLSGNTFYFQDVVLNASQYYSFILDGSNTQKKDTSASFPEQDTYISWLCGTGTNSVDWECVTTGAYNIQSITVVVSERESSINFSKKISSTTLWNVQACDSDGDCGFAVSNRTFSMDAQPPTINITSPLTSYNYLYSNQTLDLNWSVDDEVGHLDSCWYEYNETNTSVTCNDNTTTFNYIPNVNNLTFYANDTLGNLGSEFRSWSVRVLEDNVIYNEETTEGSYETFILELTKGSSIQIQSAMLQYNGQNVSSQIFVENNDIEIRANLLIPSVELDTNNTFYWTLNLVGGGVINTRNFTQQVNKILIGNCSTYSNSLINLLLKDEGTKNSINGTIQTNLRILNNLNYGLAYEFIGGNINVNTVNLCSNINLTETDFLLNAEIRYFADNHSTEFYHIQRANLTDYPVNLSLFTLAEEDTTVFTVVYRNQKLIGVEGAIIQLQRKYVDEGIFEIVEAPLTSSESKAILHIDTDTNKYQIVVVKNGEVLGIFENLVFVCQSELTGECVLNLFETISAPELPTLTEMTDFTYSISTNDTSQEVQVLFSVPSGTPNKVQVVLIQEDILGSSIICNETLISSSGSIICDYNKSIQDSTLELKIYKSDNLIAQKGYVVSDNILEDFGGVNYIILIIFVISLAFMAISSPEWIIINSVIALLIGGLTWLVRGLDFVVGVGGLIWLVVAAIILISKISKQEDL